MRPTLVPGDLLLVDRRARVRPGQLVVLDLSDGTAAVKRVTYAHDEGWWVERDNPRAGVDSWLVGAVAPREVRGAVRARLWPRPRLLIG